MLSLQKNLRRRKSERKSDTSSVDDKTCDIDLCAEASGIERKRKRERKSDTSSVDDKTCDIDLCAEASGIERKRKRGESSTIGKNVKRKKQRTAKDSNRGNRRVEIMDYISQLPESVIHLILSLLRSTKDAARTSILSKRWRDMWTSFSALKFDQQKFQELEGVKNMDNCNEMFKEFIDRSLQNHLERNLGIYKFALHLASYDHTLVQHIDRWIGIAIENKTKELGLLVDMKARSQYILPMNIFSAETITVLRLQGFRLETPCNINLPYLQKLYLRNLHVDHLLIHLLFSNCPQIDDLRLIHCSGLRDLQILGHSKLERVEVHYCHGLKNIEIRARKLQTFWYRGKKYMSCKIDLVDCENLKRLTLEDNKMTDIQFHGRFFSFPLLEKLDLSNCLNLKNITIASHRLKSLVLRGCKNLKEAEIDTPNLLSFEYQGDKMPFSFLNPKCLKEAKLSFVPVENEVGMSKHNLLYIPDSFHKLQQFLGKFDHEGFRVIVRTNKNVIIHENPGGISLLPQYGGLKLEIVQSSVSIEEILHSSLQKWNQETLSIVSSCSEFSKLVRENIMDRKRDQTCCASHTLSNKCWRHFLKRAKMVNLKAAKGKNESEWMVWLKSHSNIDQITSFKLSWKSNKA